MSKSAIILGATGLTGGILLQKLIRDERYEKITVIGRNSCGVEHPKLNEITTDLMELDKLESRFNANTVFCCIGTTKAKTKDKDMYRKIDKGIPLDAAKLCKKNGVQTFIVISALGADANSRIFYNKVKGEMEEGVLSQNIENTYILQPSLIKGNREESRLGEKLAGYAMQLLRPLMLGGLRKYRPIYAETIAACMVWLDNNAYGERRIPSHKFKDLVG